MRANSFSRLCWLVALLFTPFLATAEETPLPLTIEDAWVRSMPPTMRMTAAYLKIQNDGEALLKLVGASSPRFGVVEIHESYEEDGIARMRPLQAIDIPPGESAALAPGGKHIMLMKLEGKLKKGDTVSITLHFENGSTYPLEAPVK